MGNTFNAQQIYDEELQADRDDALASVVFQALGAASVCWDDDRVFDDRQAKQIGDSLVAFLHDQIDQPSLGLATTGQLLEELRARIEMDYYAGGGGLDYTTVGGRP